MTVYHSKDSKIGRGLVVTGKCQKLCDLLSILTLAAVAFLTLSLLPALVLQESSATLAYRGDHEIYLDELFARKFENYPSAADQCDNSCEPTTIVVIAELLNMENASRSVVVFFEVIDIETREIIHSAYEERTINVDSWLDVVSPWNPTREEAAVERYELKAIVYGDVEKTNQLSRVARAPLIFNPVPEPDDHYSYPIAITELYAYQPANSESSEMIMASELRNYAKTSQPFVMHFEVVDTITGATVFVDDETGTLEREGFADIAAGTRWIPEELDGNYEIKATVYSDLQMSERISRTERMPVFIGSSDVPEGSPQVDTVVYVDLTYYYVAIGVIVVMGSLALWHYSKKKKTATP